MVARPIGIAPKNIDATECWNTRWAPLKKNTQRAAYSRVNSVNRPILTSQSARPA